MENENNEQTPEVIAEDKKLTAKEHVQMTYECFLKDLPDDSESTNPVEAIKQYFEKNASDDLKKRVEAEGKTAEGAWNFAWAVGEKMPKETARVGGGFHIEPSILYSIIMHYFEDVPAFADFEPALKKIEDEKRAKEARKRREEEEKKRKEKKQEEQAKKKKKKKRKTDKATETEDAATAVKAEKEKSPEENGPEDKEKPADDETKEKVVVSTNEKRERDAGQGFLLI